MHSGRAKPSTNPSGDRVKEEQALHCVVVHHLGDDVKVVPRAETGNALVSEVQIGATNVLKLERWSNLTWLFTR